MSRARSARRTPLVMLIAAFAVAAMLGQALLPHVHAWQSGGHGSELRIVRGTGPSTLAADARHDHDHERTACPTCQALTQSRQLGAAPRTLPFAVALVHAVAPTPVVPAVASPDVAASAAPRAPPALA